MGKNTKNVKDAPEEKVATNTAEETGLPDLSEEELNQVVSDALDSEEKPIDVDKLDHQAFISKHLLELKHINKNHLDLIVENAAPNGYAPKFYFGENYERTASILRSGIGFNTYGFVSSVRPKMVSGKQVIFTTMFLFIDGKWFPYSMVAPKFAVALQEKPGCLYFIRYDGKIEKEGLNSRGPYKYEQHSGIILKVHTLKQFS